MSNTCTCTCTCTCACTCDMHTCTCTCACETCACACTCAFVHYVVSTICSKTNCQNERERTVLHHPHTSAVSVMRDQGGHWPFLPAFAAFDFFLASSLNSIFLTCSGSHEGERVDAWVASSPLVGELCSVCAVLAWMSNVAAPLSALIRMKKEAKSSGVDRTT